ncbi:fatty acid amide hydrolase-like isoform X2 [Pseudonaja textilis]|uniref:fatty acid amide hydrolase-like isoform X2 n=1 Tax=Pseudonaja textilis TaxID=8673 RepID=UPI000EA91B64|nr:fatty acid amide hydrolase-like isoform X2 [Pseudonaja textilis]
MKDEGWQLSTVAWGAPLFVLFYLGFLRRVTGAAGIVFHHRRPGRFEKSWSPPVEAWSPRLSGFPLKLCVHLANTAFGQLFLVPFLMRMNNFTALRYLDIPEDPTFLPLVVSEKKEHKSESKNVSAILQSLMESSSCSASSAFRFKRIQDYLKCYRSGEITPQQVAKNIIAALKEDGKAGPNLQAIAQWNEEEIIQMAEESTARYRSKQPLSLLDGIPVCLKEEIKVVPYHHRSGTVYLGKKPETEDATVTKKLREAGAIIIGVSNMHELGIGTTGCNPNRYHGTTRNPYNPQHFTGGSSSGSAAAVAAGLCPLAVGTDGGGSVRIPASFCGIVGLKGTFGRISGFGCHPLSYSTVGLGPLCTSVTDAAIAYATLAGSDLRYPYGLHQPEPSFSENVNTNLNGLKLGIDWSFFKACDSEILAVCQKVEFLVDLGASVVEVSLPEIEEARVAHVICILSEMRDFLQPDFNNQFEQMNLETRLNLAIASQITALDYIKANRQRSRSMASLKEIFSKVDCLLTPGTACCAPVIHESDLVTGCSDVQTTLRTMKYMQLANLTGIPALVVPVGYTISGLPISLQMMTKWWNEALLFQIGLKLEQFHGTLAKPIIYYDILR